MDLELTDKVAIVGGASKGQTASGFDNLGSALFGKKGKSVR